MADDLEILMQRTKQELARLAAEEKALKQKILSLRATESELTERIGDHMENLKVKMRLEELQRAAGKFAADLEERGI
jgi:hypothetical protein